MSKKAYHTPDGTPCSCGATPKAHRVEHHMMGTPVCINCGLGPAQHRDRDRQARKPSSRRYYIGIDGEGIGRVDHKYIMLCASDESGEQEWSVHPENGLDYLRTEQCLDFILALPMAHTRLYSYAFNYDLTKMLYDLDNESLYKLFRPDLRRRDNNWAHLGPKPVEWNGYKLNLQGTKFTVQKDGRRQVIWDLFKFFQGKFVGALKTWQVGNQRLWDRMSDMKDNRSDFEILLRNKQITTAEIEAYCLEECSCMAQLARKLVDAHEEAGIALKSFYGAGSSGGAMLSAMGIKEKNVPVMWQMRDAVAQSFFGGRFENSFTGAIDAPVFMKDISSAYPYQTTFLPCLEHGKWKLTKKREEFEGKKIALVNYCFSAKPKTSFRWGPFPFRTYEGSICFPEFSGGGWVWQDEFREGEKLFSHVRFIQAWVYETNCKCKPFAQIPEYYLLRLKLGKEGAGLVIKLAVNSIYGKLAQSVGSATFNNWIWAALITSGCRAQLLNGLGRHNNWDRVLMMATDSIGSLDDVVMADPKPTGTAHTGKPLGGWENKTYEKGIFLARPGIYFPLAPDEAEMDKIKARGLGRKILLDNWQEIVRVFEEIKLGERESKVLQIANISRFCGAKTSISQNGAHVFTRAGGGVDEFGRVKPSYGQWIGRRVDMSFNPMPKRERIERDGRLAIRSLAAKELSQPYRKALVSKEAAALKEATDIIMEQPNADLQEEDLHTTELLGT